MGDLNEKYIVEAATFQQKAKNSFQKWVLRAACFFLMIVIMGSTMLVFSVEARAAFLGWIKEVYETYIVYRFEGKTDSNPTPEEYRPTWVPTGYEEYYTDNSENDFTAIYANAIGQNLTFSYSKETTDSVWFVNNSMTSTKQTYVNEMPADILIADNIEIGSANCG